MNEFFYETGGQSSGPVPEGELHSLFQQGRITSTTRVWHEGMDSWQGYGERFPEGAPKNDAGPSAAQPEAGAEPESTRCAVSGRTGLKSEMVDFGGVHVLPEFRDEYVQRLQQGCVAPLDLEPLPYRAADCWPRLAAWFIDAVIVRLPGLGASYVMGAFTGIRKFPYLAIYSGGATQWFFYATLVLYSFYEIIAISTKGATLGKMMMGIKVVQTDGTPPGFRTAFKRFLVKGVAGHICGLVTLLSGIRVVTDPRERKAVHDGFARTCVIKA